MFLPYKFYLPFVFGVVLFLNQLNEINCVWIQKEDLETAFKIATSGNNDYFIFKDIRGTTDQSSARMQMISAITNESLPISQVSLVFENVTRYLMKKYNLNKSQVLSELPNLDIRSIKAAQSTIQKCDAIYKRECPKNDKYRSFDGSCNNPKRPNWGRAFECFLRFGIADYSDGLSKPRTAYGTGGELPNPRDLSEKIHNDLDAPSNEYTLMLMQFGQLVSHDINLTPNPSNRNTVDCCVPEAINDPFCLSIPISEDDPFYKQFKLTCMNFVRSSTCTPYCKLGPRYQINQVTSFLDLSLVYGNSIKESNSLRTLKDGKLKSQSDDNGELLPKSFNPTTDQCSRPAENKICFQAGDPRVNQHPALTTLQTLFLRQHNRIADLYRKINSRSNPTDEIIFQETRRIVIAQYQVIVQNEYLPIILGKIAINREGLFFQETGNPGYKETVDPTLFTEFSTAVYRFGHSLIQNNFKEIQADNTVSSLPLKDNFFNAFILYEGSVETLLRGMADQKSQSFDPHLVDAVRDFLYKNATASFGLDLAATNIQRGRDNGIPSYVSVMQQCDNYRPKTFDQLKFMSKKNQDKLSNIYKHVEDIDLFTGGLSEDRVYRSIFGPTFLCIAARQFGNLKYGDRYYFEHANQPYPFDADQLADIKRTTLSEIICRNAKINEISYNVFLPSNGKVKCNQFGDIQINLYQDK